MLRRLTLLLSAGLLGCGSLKVYSSRDEAADGIRYMVPKGVIDVAVTYTLTTVGGSTPSSSVAIASPPRAVVRLIGDSSSRWTLVGNTVSKNPFVDSKMKVSISDVGTISTIGFETVDRTAEVLQGVVGVIVQTAKLVTAGRALVPSGDSQCTSEVDREKTLKAEILEDNHAGTHARVARIKALHQELAIVDELLARCQADHRAPVTRSEITYYTTLDPDDPKVFNHTKPDSIFAVVQPPAGFIKEKVAIPPVFVSLMIAPPVLTNQEAEAVNQRNRLDGVVYREPGRVTMAIELEMENVKSLSFRGDLLIPQFGRLQVGKLVGKKLGSRSTAMTFSEATGGLREYSVGSTTGAKAAADNVTSALANVQQGLLDIRYGLPTQQATLQKNLRDAQGALKPAAVNELGDSTLALIKLKAFIDAQIELAKAQRVLDSLRSRNP